MKTPFLSRIEEKLAAAGNMPVVAMRVRDVKVILLENKALRDYASRLSAQRVQDGLNKLEGIR